VLLHSATTVKLSLMRRGGTGGQCRVGGQVSGAEAERGGLCPLILHGRSEPGPKLIERRTRRHLELSVTAMVGAGREQQRSQLGGHIQQAGIERMVGGVPSTWPTPSPRHELVQAAWANRRSEPPRGAVAVEIKRRAEVGIGVVMAAHHHASSLTHRQSALDEQGDLLELEKPRAFEVGQASFQLVRGTGKTR